MAFILDFTLTFHVTEQPAGDFLIDVQGWDHEDRRNYRHLVLLDHIEELPHLVEELTDGYVHDVLL